MKPTKKQKLEWIRGALTLLHEEHVEYTCHAFEDSCDGEGRAWYDGIVDEFDINRRGTSWDYEFDFCDALDARILWLSFLHLWISEGELE